MMKSVLSGLEVRNESSVCMVLAVMAPRANALCASMVLASARIPAPPQGSKPPMAST